MPIPKHDPHLEDYKRWNGSNLQAQGMTLNEHVKLCEQLRIVAANAGTTLGAALHEIEKLAYQSGCDRAMSSLSPRVARSRSLHAPHR